MLVCFMLNLNLIIFHSPYFNYECQQNTCIVRIFELEKSEISGELKQLRNEKLHFTVRTLIHHCYVENTHNGRAFCPICIIYPRSMVHIYMAFVSHYTVPLFKHTLKYSLRNLNCLINDTVEYTVTAVNMSCKHENVRILMTFHIPLIHRVILTTLTILKTNQNKALAMAAFP